MLIYARNQQLNLAQQFFGLWAKAARASARLLRGLSGLGIVVDRSTTYHSMRVMARNAAEVGSFTVTLDLFLPQI